jgi:hypothetical protein
MFRKPRQYENNFVKLPLVGTNVKNLEVVDSGNYYDRCILRSNMAAG